MIFTKKNLISFLIILIIIYFLTPLHTSAKISNKAYCINCHNFKDIYEESNIIVTDDYYTFQTIIICNECNKEIEDIITYKNYLYYFAEKETY